MIKTGDGDDPGTLQRTDDPEQEIGLNLDIAVRDEDDVVPCEPRHSDQIGDLSIRAIFVCSARDLDPMWERGSEPDCRLERRVLETLHTKHDLNRRRIVLRAERAQSF